MSRHVVPAVEENRSVEAPRRCLSCNGIIAGLAEQDLGNGLNIKLGLVSDECALICNGCTAKLIEMQPASGTPVTRLR
ncbi:hypothetical protein Q3C01_01555 [Bradyrhizobium sp. UFLA05-109]